MFYPFQPNRLLLLEQSFQEGIDIYGQVRHTQFGTILDNATRKVNLMSCYMIPPTVPFKEQTNCAMCLNKQ